MAEDKEIQKQVKEGLTDLKEATKQGVTSVNQEAKKAIADIKQQTKDSVAKATEQIDKKTEKSVQQIDKTTEKATQSVEKATAQSIKDINNTTKDSVKSINAATKDGSKNIETAAKNSVKDIVGTTKDSINNINSTTKDSVKDIDSTAKNNIKNIEEASDNSVKTINDATDTSVSKIDDASEKQVEVIENKSAEQQQEIQQKIDDQANDTFSKIKDVTQKVADEFKKRAEQLQDQLDGKLAGNQQKQADPSKDITTKLLQNILSEIKILRKVTERSVWFDAKSGRYRDAKGRYIKEGIVREQKDNKKEESEKDKKRKGFFTSIKDKFAKPKDDSKNKLTPVKQGNDGTPEVSSLFTPLVLAGLIALIGSKEVLAFLKGFLGELLFGENANGFLAGFIAFIAVWKTMKFVKAMASFLKILKPVVWIGRLLLLHPFLRGLIGLISAMYFFGKSWVEIQERKQLEDELKHLKSLKFNDTKIGREGKKINDERIQEIERNLEDLSRKGIFTSLEQQGQWYKEHPRFSGDQKQSIESIIKYDEIVEQFKNKQYYEQRKPPDEIRSDLKDTYEFRYLESMGAFPKIGPIDANTVRIDPTNRDRLLIEYGFNTPALRDRAEKEIARRKNEQLERPREKPLVPDNMRRGTISNPDQRQQSPTPRTRSSGNITTIDERQPVKPNNPLTSPRPVPERSSDAVPATASSAPTPESKPTATPASNVAPSTSTPAATPNGTSQNQSLPTTPSQRVEEKPQLQPTTPSSGETINNSSVAVDAEYQQPPQDTVSVMNNDTTKIAKPSNVINSMPGIFADRSYFSQFEIFNNNQFSTLSSAGAGDG